MSTDSATSSPPLTNKIKRHLPGVEGVWAFVFADMVVFAVMFGSFMYDRSQNLALFEKSRQALNLDLGGINTLLLLTSSMLVVLALNALKLAKPRLAPIFFALALTCGLTFIVLKAIEYNQKFDAGISILSNDFFMYYFVMTGMHLGHVVVGNAILAVLLYKSRSAKAGDSITAYESGATYWHMVDLLWICLFPLLYLVR
jgi:nitric oxide reductase NorE protein